MRRRIQSESRGGLAGAYQDRPGPCWKVAEHRFIGDIVAAGQYEGAVRKNAAQQTKRRAPFANSGGSDLDDLVAAHDLDRLVSHAFLEVAEQLARLPGGLFGRSLPVMPSEPKRFLFDPAARQTPGELFEHRAHFRTPIERQFFGQGMEFRLPGLANRRAVLGNQANASFTQPFGKQVGGAPADYPNLDIIALCERA